MFLILFQRVMYLEDKIVLYVVPKIINSNNKLNSIKSCFQKEQKSLAKDVFMLKPVLVGEYDLSRYKLYKFCKSDKLLEKYINSELFLHYTNSFNNLNISHMNNFSNDIKQRLQFILKKYETKLILNFEQIIHENLIEYKSFYVVKRIKHVKFDMLSLDKKVDISI
jgi:hypothetical protein